MSIFLKHPLFKTLFELKGNPRISVMTEVLFGIPYNLFMPFFSIYMLAIGIKDQQIGMLASLGLIVQVFSALLSGAVVDKFGRRITLLFADIISWGIPCLIWAVAKDLRYFIVAAALNGIWRLAHTAWTCLVVEDAEERHLVHIWTWITIFAVCSAFFTPLGGWFVKTYGLIPAVRGIYVLGFVMFTSKAFILFFNSHETQRGYQRKEETRNQSLFSLLGEYRHVLPEIWRSRPILAALALMVITNIYFTVSGSFWGVLFTSKLGFSDSEISTYVALRSIIITASFFIFGARFTNPRSIRLPLGIGFLAFFISQAMLVMMPARAVGLLVISVILEAVASALVNPMTEALLSLSLESKERARVSAIVYMLLITIITPFGWVAGQLSAIDRALPFAFNMGLFAVGLVLVWFISRPGFIHRMPEPL